MKIIFIKFSLIIIAIFTVIFMYFAITPYYYTSNNDLISFYNDNKSVFDEYVKSIENDFTFYDESKNIGVPKELNNIGVIKIQLYNNEIYFDTQCNYCYGGLYYSFKDEYAQNTLYGTEEFDKKEYEKFGNIMVKGRKNTGENWYLTEKIDDNWFYYEFHM